MQSRSIFGAIEAVMPVVMNARFPQKSRILRENHPTNGAIASVSQLEPFCWIAIPFAFGLSVFQKIPVARTESQVS